MTGGRRIASNALAFGVGLFLLVALAALTVTQMRHRSQQAIPSVTVGIRDEIYYSHAAKREDAAALGHALQTLGFFQDRGASVLLSKNPGGTVISFVLQDGLWNSPAAVASFQEIGRRVADAVGGLPIEVRLVDSAWKVQKALQVGKIRVGSRDEIYYFGSATAQDAQALARALREAGYLQDLGVSVSLSKGDGTAVGFVVGEDVWRQPGVLARFAGLARRVAPAVGGLPLQLQLLSPEMEIKQQTNVR